MATEMTFNVEEIASEMASAVEEDMSLETKLTVEVDMASRMTFAVEGMEMTFAVEGRASAVESPSLDF